MGWQKDYLIEVKTLMDAIVANAHETGKYSERSTDILARLAVVERLETIAVVLSNIETKLSNNELRQ